MSKHFYIAGRRQRLATIDSIACGLAQRGFTRTFDWGQGPAPTTLEGLRALAERERQGVHACDFLVFVYPGGEGANIEFGIACALHKPIYLFDTGAVLDDPATSSTFYQLPQVQRFSGSVEAFIAAVAASETSG